MRSGEDLKRHFNIEFNLILKSNSIMATVTKDKGKGKKVFKMYYSPIVAESKTFVLVLPSASVDE